MRPHVGAPASWTWSKVKHTATFFTGWTPPTGEQDLFDGENLWANISDLGPKHLRNTAKRISDEAVRRSAIPVSVSGSVLFSFKLSIGQVSFVDSPMYTNEAIATFPPQPGFNPRWAFWALPVFVPENAKENIYGAKLLNRELIRSADILVPPPQEQERIANFLDEQAARIDALIAEKQELLDSLREYQFAYSSRIMIRGLKADVPLKESGHPELGLIPAHWSVKRLKFLGDVRSGIAKGKDHGERDTVSLPYLRVANVQDGYVDLTDVQEIEVGKHEVARFLLRPGDVLMNEGGDNDKLGRGTVWEGQIDPCVHQNHVFAVRLADVNSAAWVARFTSTDSARTYFFLRSKQSTNLASINQTNVRELPVPMPPDEERQRILEELERTASATAQLATHVTEHLERLKEYRSSLISAAVTGQLDLSTSNKSH